MTRKWLQISHLADVVKLHDSSMRSNAHAILLIVFLLLPAICLGQWACNTKITLSSKSKSLEFAPTSKNFVINGGFHDIPIQFHLLRKDDGTDGISPEAIPKELAALNAAFAPAHVRFVEAATASRYDDSRLFDFTEIDLDGKEDRLCEHYDVKGVVNVYCVRSLTDLEGGQCAGYTHFTDDHSVRNNNRIFLTKDYFDGGSTFIHEMGHFFGLYHTHELAFGSEYADGTNSANAGDLIEDTPADPYLPKYQDHITEDCQWVGFVADPRNNPYDPDVSNYMCYAPVKHCRDHFTEGQIQVIASYAIKGRPGLNDYLQEQFETNRIRPGFSGKIYFEAGGRRLPVTLDENLFRFTEPAFSHEVFRIYTDNLLDSDIFVYAFNMDSRGVIVTISGEGNTDLVKKGSRKFSLPNATISLDENTGTEYLCVLYSNERLEVLTLCEQLRRGSGTLIERIYAVLGDRLLSQAEVRLGCSGGMMDFEATPVNDKKIMPILMALEHK